MQVRSDASRHPTAPFARPGACASALHKGGTRSEGWAGTNESGNDVGDRDENVENDGDGGDDGDGDGDVAETETGSGKGTQDVNGFGSGDENGEGGGSSRIRYIMMEAG